MANNQAKDLDKWRKRTKTGVAGAQEAEDLRIHENQRWRERREGFPWLAPAGKAIAKSLRDPTPEYGQPEYPYGRWLEDLQEFGDPRTWGFPGAILGHTFGKTPRQKRAEAAEAVERERQLDIARHGEEVNLGGPTLGAAPSGETTPRNWRGTFGAGRVLGSQLFHENPKVFRDPVSGSLLPPGAVIGGLKMPEKGDPLLPSGRQSLRQLPVDPSRAVPPYGADMPVPPATEGGQTTFWTPPPEGQKPVVASQPVVGQQAVVPPVGGQQAVVPPVVPASEKYYGGRQVQEDLPKVWSETPSVETQPQEPVGTGEGDPSVMPEAIKDTMRRIPSERDPWGQPPPGVTTPPEVPEPASKLNWRLRATNDKLGLPPLETVKPQNRRKVGEMLRTQDWAERNFSDALEEGIGPQTLRSLQQKAMRSFLDPKTPNQSMQSVVDEEIERRSLRPKPRTDINDQNLTRHLRRMLNNPNLTADEQIRIYHLLLDEDYRRKIEAHKGATEQAELDEKHSARIYQIIQDSDANVKTMLANIGEHGPVNVNRAINDHNLLMTRMYPQLGVAGWVPRTLLDNFFIQKELKGKLEDKVEKLWEHYRDAYKEIYKFSAEEGPPQDIGARIKRLNEMGRSLWRHTGSKDPYIPVSTEGLVKTEQAVAPTP